MSSGGVGLRARGYSLESRAPRGAGSRTKTCGNLRVSRVVVVTVFVSTHSLTSSWKRRLLLGLLLGSEPEMLTETVCALLGRRGSEDCLFRGLAISVIAERRTVSGDTFDCLKAGRKTTEAGKLAHAKRLGYSSGVLFAKPRGQARKKQDRAQVE
jgi:hypothetical protein